MVLPCQGCDAADVEDVGFDDRVEGAVVLGGGAVGAGHADFEDLRCGAVGAGGLHVDP